MLACSSALVAKNITLNSLATAWLCGGPHLRWSLFGSTPAVETHPTKTASRRWKSTLKITHTKRTIQDNRVASQITPCITWISSILRPLVSGTLNMMNNSATARMTAQEEVAAHNRDSKPQVPNWVENNNTTYCITAACTCKRNKRVVVQGGLDGWEGQGDNGVGEPVVARTEGCTRTIRRTNVKTEL